MKPDSLITKRFNELAVITEQLRNQFQYPTFRPPLSLGCLRLWGV